MPQMNNWLPTIHVSELPEADLAENNFALMQALPNSEQFAIVYPLKDKHSLVFIGKNGELSNHQIIDLSNYCDFTLINHIGGGTFLYPNTENIEYIIYDYLDDTQIFTTSDLINEKIHTVQYLGDAQGFLLFSSTSCQNRTGKLWHLSITDGTVTLLSDDIPLPIEFSEQTKYSPYKDADLSLIQSHNDNIVIPTEESLYMFDLTSRTLINFGDLIQNSGYFLGKYDWTFDESELLFSWHNNNTNTESIYSYNLILEELNELVEADIEYGAFSLSPNQQYLMVDNSEQLCCQLLILDRHTNDISSIDFENYDYRPQDSFSEFLWHPSSEWVIVLGRLIGDYRYVYLVDTTANTLRELGICIREESCFGWLPSERN